MGVMASLRATKMILGKIPPPLVIWLFCFAGCGDNSVEEVGVEGAPLVSVAEVAEAPWGPQDVAQVLHPRKNGEPRQLTLLEEHELDTEDPTVLQIPAPEKYKAFILAGSQKLLENATAEIDTTTAIRLAQSMLLSIARADIVVLAGC